MANVKQYNLTGLSANVELGKKGSYLAGSGNAIGFYAVNGELQKLSIGNAVVDDQAVTVAQLNVVAQDLVQNITVPVAFNDEGNVTIANIAAGSRILTVTVEIDTVWDTNIPNFVIQGGDVETGDGLGGPDFVIPNEPSEHGFVRGAAGIASAGKDTEGSQYFFMIDWAPHLDGGYTVFGQVIAGMDVVDRMRVGDRVIRARISNL